MQTCTSEAPRHIKGVKIPDGWPKNGAITFQEYKMRYRDNTPTVLNGLDFAIQAGEKLGIVGRTGSGKRASILCRHHSYRAGLSRSLSLRSVCREIFPRRGSVQTGGAGGREHSYRRRGHHSHRPAGSAQQTLHHPPGPGAVHWYSQVPATHTTGFIEQPLLCGPVTSLPTTLTHRYNLDPFNQYTDEEIWAVLQKTYMKDSVCY